MPSFLAINQVQNKTSYVKKQARDKGARVAVVTGGFISH